MCNIENKINDSHEFLQKQIKSNEDIIQNILAEMSNKADKNEISSCLRLQKSTDLKLNGLVNHINELQKEIDSMKQETGPDFEKMISNLQKQVEKDYESTNERIHNNGRSIDKLSDILNKVKEATDKIDIKYIKLIQQVDEIQRKLDLLDEAFNGFMVPQNILGGKDTGAVEMLKESLSSLRKEFFKFKDESSSKFSVIGETLSKNADKHDLKDLENKLIDRIERNNKLMIKNKTELRRLIKDIDDKV